MANDQALMTKEGPSTNSQAWVASWPEEFITILELPPNKSAHDAVKVALAYPVKQARKGRREQ